MTTAILEWSVFAAQILLTAAMACAAFRIIRGPGAQDRVLGMDTLYVSGTMLLLSFGIRTASQMYFEAALVVSMVGFVSTSAAAKFLMRGDVIE